MRRTRIYTDGACKGNPGPGGWGAVILLDQDVQEISGKCDLTTNNRMELLAVIESLNLAVSVGCERIDVYSDSAYVVNAVKDRWIKKWKENGWRTVGKQEVKNKDLWLRLDQLLSRSNHINIIKVKGHSGDKNNERADTLAKKAVELCR